MRHLLRHQIVGTLSVASLIEALSSGSAVAIATGVAAIVTSLCGAWRSNRRQDFDLKVYETFMQAVVKAKVEALAAGKPDPLPGVVLPGFPKEEQAA